MREASQHQVLDKPDSPKIDGANMHARKSGDSGPDSTKPYVSSLWQGIVSRLEEAVDDKLVCDDPEVVSSAIKKLRHFAVASSMNKTVAAESTIISTRLLELMERFEWWRNVQPTVCIDLCVLINSLIRDCTRLSELVMKHSVFMEHLMKVILVNEGTEMVLRESCLLLLRSLFGAENLSGVLLNDLSPTSQCTIAKQLFTRDRLVQLVSLVDPYSYSHSLTDNAHCYVVQLLSLLATHPGFALPLCNLNVIHHCHHVIIGHCSTASPTTSRMETSSFCQSVIRFTLKMLVHIFFHTENALDFFKCASSEYDGSNLITCYEHLLNPIRCNVSPKPRWPTFYDRQHHMHGGPPPLPASHGTQTMLGMLRGLIYWRLVCQSTTRIVTIIDQFGNHVKTANGLGMTDSKITCTIIQPLISGCLNNEDIRLIAWICHVLVLVIQQRPGLHLWLVQTNSFVHEIDERISSSIHAVRDVSDFNYHIEFLEHLIPLLKLLACLVSNTESIRFMFCDTTMCEDLIAYSMSLKSMGSEHPSLMAEFHYSTSLLLLAFSRSFGAQHSHFRNEAVIKHILQLTNENLLNACSGDDLAIRLVDVTSSILVNLILPKSPVRKCTAPVLKQCTNLFVQLIKKSVCPLRSPKPMVNDHPTHHGQYSSEYTADLRSSSKLSPSQVQSTLLRFRLNGIWGLTNLLHTNDHEACSSVFQLLIDESIWSLLVRPPLSLMTMGNSASSPIKTSLSSCDFPRRTLSCQYELSATSERRSKLQLPPRPSSYSSPSLKYHNIDLTCGLPVTTTESDNAEDAGNTCSTTTPDPYTSFFKKITDRDTSLSTTITYHTLMLFHNLFRHRQVLDSMGKYYWWNIIQLVIAVLESNCSQPVKEQALLVLAHIANARPISEHVHQNEDLMEKLKLCMRSPNSFTKSAALIATFNLLGLGDEDDSSPTYSLNQLKDHFKPSSYPLRYYNRIRTHPRQLNQSEPHQVSTVPSISAESSLIGLINRCAAQPILAEEAEEEMDEHNEFESIGDTGTAIDCNDDDDTENDVVLDYTNPTALRASLSILDDSSSVLSPSQVTQSLVDLDLQDDNPPVETLLLSDSVTFCPNRPHRHRFRFQSGSSSETLTLAEQLGIGQGDDSTSSTSSSSCSNDGFANSTTLADLDRCTAQDLVNISASDPGETLSMTQDDVILPSVAPLAIQECLDEADISPPVPLTSNTAAEPIACMPNISEAPSLRPLSVEKSSSFKHPVHHSRHHSKRSWQIGFRQTLLPFFQELEVDHILRGTWDWLMLRTGSTGRQIKLHHLLVAWQRLYNPDTTSLIDVHSTDVAQMDASLFTSSITVESFRNRLKELTLASPPSIVADTILSNLTDRSDRRHIRHRHRRCHRHHHAQLHTRRQNGPTQFESSSSSQQNLQTPVPGTTTTTATSDTDEALSTSDIVPHH